MNCMIGKTGAAVTGIAVLSFAVSMIVGLFSDSLFASCFSSIFIAIGFIIFICSIFAVSGKSSPRAAGYCAVCFAAIYVAIILIVYFAQCTTLHLNGSLSEEALSIISYRHTGSLFFNYDILGYGFMALSTFFAAFLIDSTSLADKVLKWLLLLHGLFFPACLLLPMFPIFKPGGSAVYGTIMLEFWCAYFLPVCILGFIYFKKKNLYDD